MLLEKHRKSSSFAGPSISLLCALGNMKMNLTWKGERNAVNGNIKVNLKGSMYSETRLSRIRF
jgi:hypothetical protein